MNSINASKELAWKHGFGQSKIGTYDVVTRKIPPDNVFYVI